MRALAMLSVFLALPAMGCIAQIGGSGIVFGVGQVESCTGDYSYSEKTGKWTCSGQFVAGAAISEQGSRLVGGAVDAARSTAATVLGLPQPPSPPKEPGP